MGNHRSRALAAATSLALLLFAIVAAADWEKGVAAFNAKDYATAVTEFEAVVGASPTYAGAHYMLGMAQNGLGRTSPALASLRKAVELDGANASYRIGLAQVLLKGDQYQEAYTALQPVNPGSLDARFRTSYALLFGQAAARSNHADDAVRVVSAQAQADPRNGRLQQALGVAYDAQGDDRKAFQAFKKAFELDPTDDGVARSAVRSGIAAARRASSDQEKQATYAAAAGIAERMAASADTFEHLLLAGEAWLGGKDYGKALDWFTKAQAKQPQNALVRFYKGQCLAQLGRLDAAVTELREALKIAAGGEGRLRQQIHETLGYVFDKQGNYDQAAASYREAGKTAKADEMLRKKDAAATNAAADLERKQLEAKIAELEAKIAELERLGATDEANQLKVQIENMRKALHGGT